MSSPEQRDRERLKSLKAMPWHLRTWDEIREIFKLERQLFRANHLFADSVTQPFQPKGN